MKTNTVIRGLALAALVAALSACEMNTLLADAPPVTPDRYPELVFASGGVIYTDGTQYPINGYMGERNGVSLNIDGYWCTNPQEGNYCLRIQSDGTEAWAGVYCLADGMWAEKDGDRLDFSTYTRLSFWARGEVGGEVIQESGFGGAGNSASMTMAPITLTTDWRKVTLNIPAGTDLSALSGLFYFSVDRAQTFYLDNITWL